MYSPVRTNNCCKSYTKQLQENETQTSKTILQLAAIELDGLSKGSLSNKKMEMQEQNTDDGNNGNNYQSKTISAKAVANKNNHVDKNVFAVPLPQLSRFIIKRIRIKVMEDSMKQKQYKNNSSVRYEIESDNDEDLSPENDDQNLPDDLSEAINIYQSSENDSAQKDEIANLLGRIKCPVWNTALEALKELTVFSKNCSIDLIYPYMPEVNQALIQLLQSPRSHVCRMCCQIAGEIFKAIGDVRRPEFDDLVELLLNKTADVNRFIKTDANYALDTMVSSVPPFHSIRTICTKGTRHKNDAVRVTASRLFIQIITSCGANLILGHGGNEFTRKRILSNMLIFQTDKSAQVRQNGEKICMMLRTHPNFELFMKQLQEPKGRRRNEV